MTNLKDLIGWRSHGKCPLSVELPNLDGVCVYIVYWYYCVCYVSRVSCSLGHSGSSH